jgi:hypothetical protein
MIPAPSFAFQAPRGYKPRYVTAYAYLQAGWIGRAVHLPPAVADLLDSLFDRCTGLAALLRLVTDFVPLTTCYACAVLLTASTSLSVRHRFGPL